LLDLWINEPSRTRTGSAKLQTPSSREAPNFKLQDTCASIGVWSLELPWSLGFDGASSPGPKEKTGLRSGESVLRYKSSNQTRSNL
jgi:hypothetical protein